MSNHRHKMCKYSYFFLNIIKYARKKELDVFFIILYLYKQTF